MRTLRSRLILSHLLPILVISPLVGLGLNYLLETQVLLTSLTDDLTQQAALIAAVAADQPAIWNNPAEAKIFVTRFNIQRQVTVRLINPNGKLVASNNPGDADRLGTPLELPALTPVLTDSTSVQVNYSQNLQTNVVEILVPVINPKQGVVGLIQLNQTLANVSDRFVRLRNLIAGMVGLEMLLGAVIGLALAFNLARPIRQVTQAVFSLASGRQWTTLPEQGPQETQLLARSFNTLIERLRLLEESRRRMLANIVHEVGRPIGALQSAVEALINGADEEVDLRRELLNGMEAEINRMHPLLDNLTDLHGQILGTLEFNFHPTPLTDWLNYLLGPWREAAQAKEVQWQADIPPELPTIELDPDRMAQVVGNLISNAIKFTPAGGSVSVKAGIDESSVWIQVGDTGPGIPEDEQLRIFEPFYRSQASQQFPKGMGLGLTIAQDLIKAHGGRLELDSQPSHGSRFTVYLPRQT
jgi:signal transduction histidine kinase